MACHGLGLGVGDARGIFLCPLGALLRMIREAGLEVPTLPRPSLWTPTLPGTPAFLAVVAAGEDWASGVLASLAAGERVLRDGTALFYGSFSLLTEDLSISLPA